MTDVEREAGGFTETRRRYLQWLEGYLIEHGFADSAHRQLVHATLRRARFPRVHRVADAVRRLLWRVKEMLGIAAPCANVLEIAGGRLAQWAR